MVDLSSEMAELWASLGASVSGRGRVVQITAARRGEGVSTVARELALFAARRAGRSVWLVDLDLIAAPQHAAIVDGAARYGALSEPAQASPDGSMFFTIQPQAQTAAGEVRPDAQYLAAHRVGAARWWVTRFQRERLAAGQGIHVLAAGNYWDSLRRVVDLVIVDGPSPERSRAGLTVSPFMDQTVLVVAADQPDVGAPARMRDAVMAAGGNVAGLFFNRGVVEPPGFLSPARP